MLKYLTRIQIKRIIQNNLHRRNYVTNSEQKLCVNFIETIEFLKPNLKTNTKYNCRYFSQFLNEKQRNLSRNSVSVERNYEENIYDNVDNDGKELEILSSQFPAPKSVLHNYFNVVAHELKSNKFKVSPQFKSTPVKNRKGVLQWICTYSIKWPEEIKFQTIAFTKQEASCKAAYKVLSYLKKSGKILRNGSPKLYDEETVRTLITDNNFTLHLNESIENKLNTLYNIFETNLKSIVVNKQIQSDNDPGINESDFENVEFDLSDWRLNRRKVKHHLDLYRAKETVQLPIQNHREEFEELLDTNRIIIIRGEPGCGKSTRIPQYVLEHWVTRMGFEPASIIVTQPRRIAAISLAERVAHERQETVGKIVGYHVRLKSNFNQQTGHILYCTTGILLRQLQSDAALTQCTHVILDEAHERDVNTDLLMNLMRQALTLNPNLKLIIMSATIDVGLFQNYFKNPPVMNVPGFAYPVKVHFLNEINLNLNRTRELWNNGSSNVVVEDVVNMIKWIDKTKPEGAILCFLPGWDEIRRVKQLLTEKSTNTSYIIAIHSKLSNSDQHKIFDRPPPGIRKIILATNIAETSVTINDVVYVVDTGIHKETRFDSTKGIGCIDNHIISQSSMNQRKGRAGRVQPGESYHLYPKKSYETMSKYSIPEIQRVSLTKIVLDAKVYSRNMNALEFFSQLPCPPPDSAVAKAVQELQELDMLDSDENLTPLGRVVSDFQLPPKLSKAMVQSIIYKCVVPIVDIATLYSYESNMFATLLTDKEGIRETKKKLCADSDHIASMILFEQWAGMVNDQQIDDAQDYCLQHNLQYHKLNMINKLKDIHYDYLTTYLKNTIELANDYSYSKEFIKGVLLSGVGTVLFHRNWDMVRGRFKRGNVFLTKDKHKASITSESVNFKKLKCESPFLLYINEMHSEMRRTTLIRETSVIQPLTFLLFKNCDLCINEVISNSKTTIEDPVLLNVLGIDLKILCNRKQALILKNCKHALNAMENYFVNQLTKGGNYNPKIMIHWNEMLATLNDVLKTDVSE